MNPLSAYNSQGSFNASNTSFNTTTNASLLDQTYGTAGSTFSPSATITAAQYVSANQSYSQNKPTYNQSAINLQTLPMSGNYSPNSSNYSNNTYDATPSFTQNTSSSYDNSYDNLVARKSIDDMKKQFDEQLLTKVSQMSLEEVTKLLAQKQMELNSTSTIYLNQLKTSKDNMAAALSCRDITTNNNSSDKEEFC